LVDVFVRLLDRDIVGHLGQFNNYGGLTLDVPTFARAIEKLQAGMS
jgi:hypothetical protein